MEPAVRSLTIQNLLSFGGEGAAIDLQSLNVLIGPNGSGKSNLIETIGLLQNAPKELATAISNGGPIEEWLWKGAARAPTASIEALIARERMGLRYRLRFAKAGYLFAITDELIQDATPLPGKPWPYIYYSFADGRATLIYNGEKRTLRQEDINPQISILAQRKDPEHYPRLLIWANCLQSSGSTATGNSAPSRRSGNPATRACPASILRRTARILGWFSIASWQSRLSSARYPDTRLFADLL
jgi:predicted ATPase